MFDVGELREELAYGFMKERMGCLRRGGGGGVRSRKRRWKRRVVR
jgi:hypothetical protein